MNPSVKIWRCYFYCFCMHVLPLASALLKVHSRILNDRFVVSPWPIEHLCLKKGVSRACSWQSYYVPFAAHPSKRYYQFKNQKLYNVTQDDRRKQEFKLKKFFSFLFIYLFLPGVSRSNLSIMFLPNPYVSWDSNTWRRLSLSFLLVLLNYRPYLIIFVQVRPSTK